MRTYNPNNFISRIMLPRPHNRINPPPSRAFRHRLRHCNYTYNTAHLRITFGEYEAPIIHEDITKSVQSNVMLFQLMTPAEYKVIISN